MRSFFAIILLASLVLITNVGAPDSAVAQRSQADTAYYELPLTLVTATRSEERIDRVASSVTVLTREELDQAQIRTVEEALRSVPGLDIVRSGSAGKASSAFLRGANSTHTLVLVDGVQVNSPTNGGFDFSSLTTDNIERIEVVRGPQSALYGSNAVGGVINILTREGQGKPEWGLYSEGGRYGTLKGAGTASGAFKWLGYSAAVSRTKTEGLFKNDDYANTTLSSRLAVTPVASVRVGLMAQGALDELGVPGQRTISYNPSARQKNRNLLLAYRLDHRVSRFWDYQLRLSRATQQLNYDDPANQFISKIRTVANALDWQSNLMAGPLYRLTFGYEWRGLSGKTDSASPFGNTNINRRITQQAAYIQEYLDISDKVQITAGLRFDHHSTFGWHRSVRLTAGATLPTATRFKGSFGTGYRAPSLDELYYPDFGNPNLKPERSRTYDVGVEQPLAGRRAVIGVTWFETRFRDLIGFDQNFVPANLVRAKTKGLEATGTFRPDTRLTFGASYTYLLTKDETTGERLRRRPKHHTNLSVDALPTRSVRVSTRFAVIGQRFDDSFDFSLPLVDRRRLYDGYAKLDLAVSWAVLPHLTLNWRVENALNRNYAEAAGYPSPKINVISGLQASF